jgi:polar amino acid transport system permease protein
VDLRWEILAGYGPLFASGLWMTLKLTAVAIAAGLVLGVLFGLVGSSAEAPRPASRAADLALRATRVLTVAYVAFFRGTPLFVQILLVHFALMPALVHPDHGLLLAGDAARAFRQEHGAFLSGCVALSLNAGAYISEIFRAGIQSIHRGQTQAAYSVGLSHAQAMRHVVLPQAVRRVIPPLLNDFIGLQKDSALVAFLGVIEGLQTANIISSAEFNYTPFVSLALVYLVITIPQTRFVAWLIARDRRRRQGGTVV